MESKKNMYTFLTLPIELVYRIMDHQSDFTLFCSMQNVCRRFNQILNTYHRYLELTKLDLCSKQIGDQGAQHIGYGLRTNTTLTALDLGENQMGDQGAQHIGDALRMNTTLTQLILWNNQIADERREQLRNCLVNRVLC
ncbi:hypothetical protein I4U23_017691 [Adineta vaga]|nr:hypothetical protein I4U23_017691 [Adineta vaga]